MKRSRRAIVAALVLAATGASAQGPGRLTGNPTPGTEQPAPPNLVDRITVTGCVQFAAAQGRGIVPPDQLNMPSDSTFVLANAAREGRLPPGTGTSESTKKAASRIYRLSAINSALVPFVGSKVELSGEIDSSFSPSGSTQGPLLHVGFVRRIAKACS